MSETYAEKRAKFERQLEEALARCHRSMGTIGDVMSNFDGVIDRDVEAQLKGDTSLKAGFPGWDFHGTVRWNGDAWECVFASWGVKGSPVTTETLEDLRTLANQYFPRG